MLFGFDGVELGLIIVFICLFGGILSGYPVAFAIGGSAILAFGILAILGDGGYLIREVIDTRSDAYRALLAQGIGREDISRFAYPELPTVTAPLFEHGAEGAFFRTITFIVNRMNERVLAGQSIETLLAVAMFVLMGITLERSRIAEDLLTTMARVFGQLPGGLAVSVVVVGAFLAASTGIVGATVVTMGLLSLPTMLRNRYSPELATGVITASGTLGQVIPPSIVIVLLGTLAGDLYATGQEDRAQSFGCPDALTYLGEPAVLSVGTLFKAAVLPGLMLALLYGLYAFGYALIKPENAPPVRMDDTDVQPIGSPRHKLLWFLVVPALLVALVGGMFSLNMAGDQTLQVDGHTNGQTELILRTNVSGQCKKAMIAHHGQDAWDRSVAFATAKQTQSDAGAIRPSQTAKDDVLRLAASRVPPLSTSVVVCLLLATIAFTTAYGINPNAATGPILVGLAGAASMLAADAWLVTPIDSAGSAAVVYGLPILAVAYGLRHALSRLAEIELLRVVFPPFVLIVAVLGSILGGITNPTPAAGLGAAGAIMLAAYRRLPVAATASRRFVLTSAMAIVVFLLVGVNFDVRTGISNIAFENWVAIIATTIAYHIAFAGLVYATWILFRDGVLGPVVRESAKVTAMVFAILIGSQLLNLVIISFGGEHYIQSFLKSFEEEMLVFLIVMLVLFFLGFVLDFLEIIYIVIPIVGPVIYGGTLDPKWVTIMIAVNLQTSFLTPPFGFALFYLRGVAPPEITTGHIYRGVFAFVVIQVIGLGLLWAFPAITTFLPNLLG